MAPVINLGNLYLTGVFPRNENESIDSGPLQLVKCVENKGGKNCGLVQLLHNYKLDKIYTNTYGYRSGLNKAMVNHLHNIVKKIAEIVDLSKGDLAIDIGSSDGTLLEAYPGDDLMLVGIDPVGEKYRHYYPKDIMLISDFFPSKSFNKEFGHKKAKVITSIAMFYDLENPMSFAQNVYDILDENGVWVFEQSYMPSMLDNNSYDTVCHEHLEYYALKQIKYIADKIGFKIIEVEINNTNGGSFLVIASKASSKYQENKFLINKILNDEFKKKLGIPAPFKKFAERVKKHREELLGFIHNAKKKDKRIIGYGASTKGNVILQFCGITKEDIPYIAEVNEDKFGSYTPGSRIPIISENEARIMSPDYLMILPWHFKDYIIEKERAYLNKGGHLFFPLPELEVV